MKYKIGVVGLGVMGHNLALNMERNGYPVAGYDTDVAKIKSFSEHAGAGKHIISVGSAGEMMAVLDQPRCVLLMVPAGAAVDSAITHLKPFMAPGDILIDGGNSFFLDTERRNTTLEAEGYNFIGAGISGGEEGALWGPSIMPGGQYSAWNAVAPILGAIAAKADDGEPCVAYIGPRGAGHYVKMVHNGIEYGDMQLIAEIYDFLRRGIGLSAIEIADLFSEWNNGELRSYLIQITAEILRRTDDRSGMPLVDLILDEAAQKGTGKWASQQALDIGAPIPTINAAVESRILSSLKGQRVEASRVLRGPVFEKPVDAQHLIEAARHALYASKITSYAQGLGLLSIASVDYQYHLNLSEIAKIWRAGCIIRADLLSDIMLAYQREPLLINLMLADPFRDILENYQRSWRLTVQTAIGMGIPVLALSASLAYFDAYRSERLPANLTQAQRDYFGAHTYRRVDLDGVFHTDWQS